MDVASSPQFWTRRRFITAATGLAAGIVLAPPGFSARAISINPRSTWALDRPPKGPLDTEDVKFLIVHHSASRNGHTSDDAPAILRAFYDYHTGTKGWNDIAYNFLIDSGGGIWEGRFGSLQGPVAGDATGGNQGFTQLVCVIGDYNAAHPTGESLNSLVSLLAWLADRYGISTSPGSEVTFVSRGSNRWPAGATVVTPTITGHRTMSQTTCPGDNLNAYVIGDLMSDVHRARGGAPPTTTKPTTTTSTSTTRPTTTLPTSTTNAETSTTVGVATTDAPTTIPITEGSTTSRPSVTSATIPAPSVTTPPPSISLQNPTTTVPLAADSEPTSSISVLPVAIVGVAGLMGGLALWRHRRMS